MVEVLFQIFKPIIGDLKVIENFLTAEGENFFFCHVTYELVEYLQKPYDYDQKHYIINFVIKLLH